MSPPLSLLVKRIRREREPAKVPGFDLRNGNERASFLFLLEAPGPGAVESGIISFDNNDSSARNFKTQLECAGIVREQIAIWNIVPWYLGNEAGDQIHAPRAIDIRDGLAYLDALVESIPNLRCIVLVGGAARRAHVHLSYKTNARILSCHHPSNRSLNINRAAMEENIAVFKFMLSLPER